MQIALIVAALLTADRFVIDSQLPAQNYAKKTANIDNLGRIQDAAIPVVEVWGPEWCKGPCAAMEKRLSSGNNSVAVRYVKSEAWFSPDQKPGLTYPFLYCPSTGRMWFNEAGRAYNGPNSSDDLLKLFDLKQRASATVSAFTVHTMTRKEVDSYLDLLGSEGTRKQFDGKSFEKFIGAGFKLDFPAGSTATWKTTVGVVRVDFQGYPTIKWGLLSQSCDWLEIRRDQIYLSLPFAPDARISIEGAAVSAVPRSPKWPHVRRKHLEWNPVCEACGGSTEINVHHVIPFHDDQSKELDPDNLITLCRIHHWEIGHDPDGPDGPQRPNWSAANKNVRADAAMMRQKLTP